MYPAFRADLKKKPVACKNQRYTRASSEEQGSELVIHRDTQQSEEDMRPPNKV